MLERRVPQQSIGRDLSVAHLADVHRVRPHRRFSLRDLLALERLAPRTVDRPRAQRVPSDNRLEELVQLLQVVPVEARSHATGVDQRSIDPVGELERAEVLATSIGLGVADDYEVAGALRLDLEPIGRTALLVRAIGFLRHDSLETHRGHLLEECFALTLDVIEISQRTERWNYILKELLPAHELEGAHVEILEGE